jgi:hypothetical protein
MPASHFDVKPMTGRPKFIVRHSNYYAGQKILAVIVCQLKKKNVIRTLLSS